MKFSRKYGLAALLLVAAAIGARAELSRWLENLEAGSIESAFFRTVTLPGGPLPVRRPPKETRPELSKLITAAPGDANLYSLRALEDEQQLDFDAAEADWKQHVAVSASKIPARLALADFYHRRTKVADELATLRSAASEPLPAGKDVLAPVFDRMLALVKEQAMPADARLAVYRQWIDRYPRNPAVYSSAVTEAVSLKNYAAAEEFLTRFAQAIPEDKTYPVVARAEIERSRGSLDKALAVYDSTFEPLWDVTLANHYIDLLKSAGRLRSATEEAKAAAAANPLDLRAATRLYYFYMATGKPGLAVRPLIEISQRKESRKSAWDPAELAAIGILLERAQNFDAAARHYYALYSLSAASAAQREMALASIAELLLRVPEQEIRFGSGDLSLYKDIATMDPYPGFLNGVLSLLFNNSSPSSQFEGVDQVSNAYFRRGRGAELVALFDSKYPNSARRAPLRAALTRAYATYGESQAVIQSGRMYLASFPKGDERVEVAGLVADAYERQKMVKEEFALYEDLLKELAAKANGVPLGEGAIVTTGDNNGQKQGAPAASPEYARVLDRYIARLVSQKRTRDAIALYRREIDRNASDPGLYERLAGFLEQNRLGSDVEQTYRKAMAQFPDPSWSHKLARWYLRQKQTAQFQQLTADVTKVFSGSDLESYLRDVAPSNALPAILYRQVNLFAHQRFPHNLTFTRNLLSAYTAKATADQPAYEALLRANWYYADDLRQRFFELLSRTKRLDAELASIRALNPAAKDAKWGETVEANPAAARLVAAGETWRSHFEDAAPVMLALTGSYPAEFDLNARTAAVHRSLAAFVPANLDVATKVEQGLSRFAPRDHAVLTRLGEMYADKERFDLARPYWNRLAEIDPGIQAGYLEAATVYWDYYLYQDAHDWIEKGRARLADPKLFAYENGAIFENQRNYDAAIGEYAKASGTDNAKSRLMLLAKRTPLRPKVEQVIAKLVSGPDPSVSDYNLQVEYFEKQDRRTDLEQFLISLSDRATSPELLNRIRNTGRLDGFPRVEERAQLRQVAIANDPVEKTSQRLNLARLYDSAGRDADAARTFEAVLKDNPASLGVIRVSVDYFWRVKNQRRSIDLLAGVIPSAQPPYKSQFALEAARKATEAGDYARARGFLNPLLADQPFDGTYLAAMADTWAREGDDRSLQDFYNNQLQKIRASTLSNAEKVERTAALRRGLIVVLTRKKDFSGAVDQYVEILNRYPEDEGLIHEAVRYAADHGMPQKLVDYYARTAAASPRDARWPAILAHIHTQLEDFPAAIRDFTTASAIRPDRIDLYISRAGLEDRLLRFEDAVATYGKVYELSYRNSTWMEKIAELRARQGKTDETVAALKKAFLEGRPDRAANYFTIASKLESWDMLPQAQEFVDKGMSLAGAGLVKDPSLNNGLEIYARLITRRRQVEAGVQKIHSLVDPSGQENSNRLLALAGTNIGNMVARYYTPEEKAAFAAYLQKGTLPGPVTARQAGLTDVEARLAYDKALNQLDQMPQALIALQTRRMRFNELGTQLEAFSKRMPADSDSRGAVLLQAVAAYRAAGDENSELRVLGDAQPQAGEEFDRYCSLLSRLRPALYASAKGVKGESLGEQGLNFALGRASSVVPMQMVSALTAGNTPLWGKAYTGLVGLYYANNSPSVRAAFLDALGDGTIGQRIGKPVDRDRQLAGDLWFYYGARYGEYLDVLHQPGSDDYLPANVEGNPAQAGAYVRLADYYREIGKLDQALVEYRDALQLDPHRAEAHSRIGSILWKQGQQDAATAEWKQAVAEFSALQDSRKVPPQFWSGLSEMLKDLAAAKSLAVVRPDVDRLLRTYARRNSTYMATDLLEGAYLAAGGGNEGLNWLTDLARAASSPVEFLGTVAAYDWVPEAMVDPMYDRVLELARERESKLSGEARQTAAWEATRSRITVVRRALLKKQLQRAEAAFRQIPEETRKAESYELLPLGIRLVSLGGRLAAWLGALDQMGNDAPRPEDLIRAVEDLKEHGDAAAARAVQAYVSQKALDGGSIAATDFLALAGVRLEEKNTSAALALLRRLLLVGDGGYQNADAAAALLEKAGAYAEAISFLETWVKSSPWDAAAKQRLASARLASGANRAAALTDLAGVASMTQAPYEVRTAAALAIRTAKGDPLKTGVGELDLLTGIPAIPAASAEQPYTYRARLEAAQAGDAATKVRLLLGAIAVNLSDPMPKLSLFRAAIDAKRYSLALSALAALEGSARVSGDDDDMPRNEPQARGFLAALRLTDGERAAILRAAADAALRTERRDDALARLKQSLSLDPSDAVKTAIRNLEQMKVLDEANSTRRPLASPNLEQDRIVRPRLAALAQGGSR